MFFSRCRQHLSREMLHGWLPRSAGTTRANFRSAFRRPLCKQSQVSLPRPYAQRLGNPLMNRSNSTTASLRLKEEGLEFPMHDDELRAVIARAKEVWPCPPIIPTGWSCAWEDWSYLLTLYWLSPYFLMLPQIEMLVNIRYRIPGETRPILYSNEEQTFIFTLVEDDRRFFMYKMVEQVLWEFTGVENEENLVRRMDEDWAALEGGLKKLVPDEEGEACVKRILERDETVIPVLAEKFLDYTPEATHEWEENPTASDEEELDEDEEIKALEKLVEDMEEALGPASEEAETVEVENELKETAAKEDTEQTKKSARASI